VRVRVLASSVEYTDVTIRRHVYPWVLRRPPFVSWFQAHPADVLATRRHPNALGKFRGARFQVA
jgi:hypothetical protein